MTSPRTGHGAAIEPITHCRQRPRLLALECLRECLCQSLSVCVLCAREMGAYGGGADRLLSKASSCYTAVLPSDLSSTGVSAAREDRKTTASFQNVKAHKPSMYQPKQTHKQPVLLLCWKKSLTIFRNSDNKYSNLKNSMFYFIIWYYSSVTFSFRCHFKWGPGLAVLSYLSMSQV